MAETLNLIRIWRGEAHSAPVVPHQILLMSSQPHVAPGSRCTRQNIPFFFVLREIAARQTLIHGAAQQSGCAGQAPALMANGGKRDSVAGGRVPNKLISAAVERTLAIRGFENDPVAGRIAHLHENGTFSSRTRTTDTAWTRRPGLYAFISVWRRGSVPCALWIVKAAILAIGSFARFAAAEVTGWYRLPIALMG